MSNCALSISELQIGWRRGCYNNGRTEDAKHTTEYNELGLQVVYGSRVGLSKSRIRRTTTTGLISCDASEHCLDSLHARNERQRWRTETKSLQSSSPRGVLMYNHICSNLVDPTQCRKESVWLRQRTGQ